MALKIGLVGLKGIGQNHAKAYSTNPLAELVAVCDVIKNRADEMAAQYKVKAYYKLTDMLDAHPELDIVDVSTGGSENGSWHFEPTMTALKAGKHVLVEKPISNDINEAREMVKLAAEKDLYLGCNLNHYFTDVARDAKRLMSEGKIGEQVYCLHRMGFIGGEATYAPGGGPNFEGKYNDLRIIRTNGEQRTLVRCDMKRVLYGKDPDPILQANDIVFLPSSAIKASLSNGSFSSALSVIGLSLSVFALLEYH